MLYFWKNKNVFITGHTGFKGAWLTKLLLMAGSFVHGYSREPETNPNLFNSISLDSELASHTIGEINDQSKLSTAIDVAKPDIIFHLAAQPLVIPSYEEPLETWNTNVLGTLSLLEVMKSQKKPCVIVIITTDKVYRNQESDKPFTEFDSLGGHDPYSASKASCEILAASFRNSYCQNGQSASHLKIATARAGNVIGGGDWSKYRIVPDIVRAYSNNHLLKIRNPNSIRPWQHVLESVYGYLCLAEKLTVSDDLIYQTAFNFGPDPSDKLSVSDLVSIASKTWNIKFQLDAQTTSKLEANSLLIDSNKANELLNWRSVWNSTQAITQTLNWYHAFYQKVNTIHLIEGQIKNYLKGKL